MVSFAQVHWSQNGSFQCKHKLQQTFAFCIVNLQSGQRCIQQGSASLEQYDVVWKSGISQTLCIPGSAGDADIK